MKTLLTEKMGFKLVDIASILFVGVSGYVDLIPVLAGLGVAVSLILLNIAKAYKIYSETRRENKKENGKD